MASSYQHTAARCHLLCMGAALEAFACCHAGACTQPSGVLAFATFLWLGWQPQHVTLLSSACASLTLTVHHQAGSFAARIILSFDINGQMATKRILHYYRMLAPQPRSRIGGPPTMADAWENFWGPKQLPCMWFVQGHPSKQAASSPWKSCCQCSWLRPAHCCGQGTSSWTTLPGGEACQGLRHALLCWRCFR